MPEPIAWLAALFAAGLGGSLALTGAARGLARRIGLVDRPDGRRKMHARVVPVAGGLAEAVLTGALGRPAGGPT